MPVNARTEKTRPRIVLLMQYYDPEPVYKGQHFAECIGKLGYDVEVVTGFPNYPTGKIYPDFKLKLFEKSTCNGINITRLPLFPSHDSNRFSRVLNYVSFFFSALVYLVCFARKMNLLYVYHPPLTVGLAAVLSKYIRRTPVIVDIHDLWPDTLSATNMAPSKRIFRLVNSACNWMYERVDYIIVHSKGFKNILVSRGVSPEKISAVIGWGQEMHQMDQEYEVPKEMVSGPGLKVLFAGNIGPAQGLDTIIDAARLLKENNQSDLVTFYFLGSGLSLTSLIEKSSKYNLTNVKFLPRVTPIEVAKYLAAADCLLLHLRDTPLFSMTIPSKMQTYMIAGKPILLAGAGEVRQIIGLANAGVFATPDDPISVVKAAQKLAEMSSAERQRMGKSASKYYWDELSMSKGLEKFAAAFSKVKK